MKGVTVSAASNIALVKYWGKKDNTRNDPATPSLSIGLDDLRTETTLRLIEGEDIISGLDDIAATRLVRFLDSVRRQYDVESGFEVTTCNNFPTGSGLASSASGFAALALGMNSLLELKLTREQVSQLARSGSGSAARSVYGGYVEVVATEDAYARPIMSAEEWPLDVVVAIATEAGKSVGSTTAMRLSADTSPFYDNWLDTHAEDMEVARKAVAERDFTRLVEVSEHNCLKMHATIMTSRPSVLYWLPATIAVMQEVISLRASGVPAFFTIDAGSQVKVICEPGYGSQVQQRIDELPGVVKTIRTTVGGEPVVTPLDS